MRLFLRTKVSLLVWGFGANAIYCSFWVMRVFLHSFCSEACNKDVPEGSLTCIVAA